MNSNLETLLITYLFNYKFAFKLIINDVFHRRKTELGKKRKRAKRFLSYWLKQYFDYFDP